jgi:hypothetical protein
MEHDPGSGLGPAGTSSMAGERSAPESTSEPASTGEPRVDAALARLGELCELPVAGHPAVYERVHEQLVEVLGELHSGHQNR